MKRDWNDRARENAQYFIASSHEDDAAFEESGERDVRLFFAGLEHLLGPDTIALDIGCGIGRMDKYVAPQVGRLIGIDVSGEMVARATERLKHVPNVEFREGDGETIPADDASVDVIFSHIVFQHMARVHARAYFRDAVRVLKPGGHFVFQMPEEADDTPPDPPEDDTWEMRFWSERDLRAELEPLGFEWVGAIRHPVVSPLLNFNQLRVDFRKQG